MNKCSWLVSVKAPVGDWPEFALAELSDHWGNSHAQSQVPPLQEWVWLLCR